MTFLSSGRAATNIFRDNILKAAVTLWSVIPPQGQADLLKHAQSEVQENLRQIHYSALTCNLSKGALAGGSSGSESRGRRSMDAIAEKATAEEELTDEDNWRPTILFCLAHRLLLFLPPELKTQSSCSLR